MMIELSSEDAQYLAVLVATDMNADRARGLDRTADRHLPVWSELQRAVNEEGS